MNDKELMNVTDGGLLKQFLKKAITALCIYVKNSRDEAPGELTNIVIAGE